MATTVFPSLSKLLQKTSIADDEEYLGAANATLQKSKNDVLAQRVRLVALLKLDRYHDAQNAVQEGGTALAAAAPFEVAYTFYKNGKLSDAKKLVTGGEGDVALRHLEAQTAYRAEDFEKASNIYKQFTKEHSHHEGSDIRINSGAVDAQLTWSGQGHWVKTKKVSREDLEQFESTFNASCLAIARGQFKQAEILLSRAKDLCNASDDISEEDKKMELLPITVQQIYVFNALSKREEAEKLRASLQLDNIPDKDTRHIAQSNTLLTNTASLSNPYLSHRLYHSTSELPTKFRPFNFQGYLLRQNAWTLDLLTSKSDGVAQSTSKYISKYPASLQSSDIAQAGVFNAAAHARSQTGKAALKEILPLLEQRPQDVGLLMTIVQLYLLTNNIAIATSLVERFISKLEGSQDPDTQALRFTPGVVALLVSLYSQQNRSAHTKAELAKAAKYWRHKSKDYHDSPAMLKAAGAALVDSTSTEQRQTAYELFQFVNSAEPGDELSIAGLIALCQDDAISLEKAQQLTDELPSIDKLTEGIDVASLEDAGVAWPAITATETESTAKKRPAEDQPQTPSKPKKIRKARLPKNYEKAKQPDPERWLPLRDRSTWRPKGKKKGRSGGGGGGSTQGGMVSNEKDRDSRPATPSQVQTASGSAQSGKAKGKKKGKK